eukprot:5811124-Heterocapsa_arctica.AAC.1
MNAILTTRLNDTIRAVEGWTRGKGGGKTMATVPPKEERDSHHQEGATPHQGAEQQEHQEGTLTRSERPPPTGPGTPGYNQ